MSFSTMVEFEIQCKCGNDLEVVSLSYGRKVTIEVQPCADCIAEACPKEATEGGATG